jgi:hypothetical protein
MCCVVVWCKPFQFGQVGTEIFICVSCFGGHGCESQHRYCFYVILHWSILYQMYTHPFIAIAWGAVLTEGTGVAGGQDVKYWLLIFVSLPHAWLNPTKLDILPSIQLYNAAQHNATNHTTTHCKAECKESKLARVNFCLPWPLSRPMMQSTETQFSFTCCVTYNSCAGPCCDPLPVPRVPHPSLVVGTKSVATRTELAAIILYYLHPRPGPPGSFTNSLLCATSRIWKHRTLALTPAPAGTVPPLPAQPPSQCWWGQWGQGPRWNPLQWLYSCTPHHPRQGVGPAPSVDAGTWWRPRLPCVHDHSSCSTWCTPPHASQGQGPRCRRSCRRLNVGVDAVAIMLVGGGGGHEE